MVQEKSPELALTWRGKHEVELVTPRPYVPAERYPEMLGIETAVSGSENRIYVGENLQVMSGLLPQYEGSVDCIYIDPPFNSGTDYVQRIRTHHRGDSKRTITVKQYGDRWQTADYLQNLYERLTLLRRFLSPTGTIFPTVIGIPPLRCAWSWMRYSGGATSLMRLCGLTLRAGDPGEPSAINTTPYCFMPGIDAATILTLMRYGWRITLLLLPSVASCLIRRAWLLPTFGRFPDHRIILIPG